MGRMIMIRLGVLLCLLWPSLVIGQEPTDPFERYGSYYGVDPDLLRAVARTESSGHPWTLNFGGEAFYLPSRKEMIRVMKVSRDHHWLVTTRYKDSRPPKRRFFKTIDAGAKYRDAQNRLSHVKRAKLIEIDPLNMDIGVMQLNWRWQKDNVESAIALTDPEYNIAYAARLLSELISQYGVTRGVGYYHNRKYERRWKGYSSTVMRHMDALADRG